jgi:hypothetical protein
MNCCNAIFDCSFRSLLLQVVMGAAVDGTGEAEDIPEVVVDTQEEGGTLEEEEDTLEAEVHSAFCGCFRSLCVFLTPALCRRRI